MFAAGEGAVQVYLIFAIIVSGLRTGQNLSEQGLWHGPRARHEARLEGLFDH